MRRTKEEAEITRQEIVKAGLRAFANKGYAAARLEDVAEEAGVTRGAIYWHFENKEDLYIQLMEQTLERYKRQVHRALEIEGSPSVPGCAPQFSIRSIWAGWKSFHPIS